MNRIAGLLLLVFTAVLFAARVQKPDQVIVPLTNPDKPGMLIINHDKGAVRINGYDGKAVIVQASMRYADDAENSIDKSSGMKRISRPALKLSAEEKNNTVRIRSNSHSKTVDLDIHLPYNFSLKISNNDNGEIKVNNINGEFEITNLNNAIIMTDVSGPAVLNTVDGDITVIFKEVPANKPMAITSIDGKIDVSFPDGVNVLFKMKSENGEVFTDFNMELENCRTKIEKKRSSGTYKVSLEEWSYGKVNGGGPEILLKSLEGNIYIRKTKK